MLRPYLRIRPAVWVHTRLWVRKSRVSDFVVLARRPTCFLPLTGVSLPRAGALAVAARARVPDGFVRHLERFCWRSGYRLVARCVRTSASMSGGDGRILLRGWATKLG